MKEDEIKSLIFEYVFGYEDYEIREAPYWMDELVQKIMIVIARTQKEPTK